ncbi:Hypothetical protein, putative [Bodo saltans]|uniref:Uncharacterized protein n=1 Tax=Bodo saltans TaxID=75058 RepID=A0A0S4KLI4_BODSA|nr:Hypothetical protein, putative [Bodo saltans]|eukprot:CUI15268.1 Hypothetical protein, putative [Bodo saltans]
MGTMKKPGSSDPTSVLLAHEALLAAAESDAACAAALSNPRMAALFVSEVHQNAYRTVDDGLNVATSGADIRRTVLQRVAVLYKSLNVLQDATPQEASTLLVESLRYALFDGYVGKSFTATDLLSGQGVSVDNAVFERRKFNRDMR